MRMKKNLVLLFLILAGAMFGSLIAALTDGIGFLSWLGYSQSIGIAVNEPMVLDLSILKLAFGFQLKVSIAQVICLLVAIWGYRSIAARL